MPDKNQDKNQAAKTKSSPKSSTAAKSSAKKPQSKLIATVIAVIVLVLIIVGAVYVFSLRQNPENIVMNAVVKVIEADSLQTSGTVKTTLEQFNGQLDVTFSSVKAKEDSSMEAKIAYQSDNIKKPVETTGQAVLGADGTVYLKLDNVSGVVATAFKEMGALHDRVRLEGSTAQPFALSKIMVNASEFLNDKWIKLPPAEAGKDSDLNPLACMQGVVAKYNANSTERRALVKAYKGNDFLVVDSKALKDKDGSNGYRVSFDETKFKAFDQAVRKTTVGKMIVKCIEGSSSATDNQEALLNGQVDLWIDKVSRRITHVNIDSFEATKLAMELDYKGEAKVSIPAEAKTITEIFSEPNLKAEAKKQ